MSKKVVKLGTRAMLLNDRLNASEARLCKKVGKRRVSTLQRKFRAVADLDVSLYTRLYTKRDPYRWIAQYWAPRQQPPV